MDRKKDDKNMLQSIVNSIWSKKRYQRLFVRTTTLTKTCNSIFLYRII